MEMMQPFLGPKDLKDLLDKVKEDKNIGKSAEDNFRSLLDVSEHLEDIRWWFDGNKVNVGASTTHKLQEDKWPLLQGVGEETNRSFSKGHVHFFCVV